jgi:hypothetical protein
LFIILSLLPLTQYRNRHSDSLHNIYCNFSNKGGCSNMFDAVKFYVSIIIHLEVININVRNFNFPIGFYSNPDLLWNPQNMTLAPFTTKLKTLGPTKRSFSGDMSLFVVSDSGLFFRRHVLICCVWFRVVFQETCPYWGQNQLWFRHHSQGQGQMSSKTTLIQTSQPGAGV